jgi:hypothetical protein
VIPSERRKRLVEWLRRGPLLYERTASEIAGMAGCAFEGDDEGAIYRGKVKRPTDLCFNDLVALENEGKVERSGRPACWEVVR